MNEWVKLVREMTALEESDEPLVMSPITESHPITIPRRASQPPGPSSPTARPQDGHVGSFTLDYSGASMSSTSELGGVISQTSLAIPAGEPSTSALRPTSPPTTAASGATGAFVVSPISTNDHQNAPPTTGFQRQESELSNLEGQLNDSRVVWHGYLYVLKSKSGIRQWKKIWVVLRPRNITFYKNDDEYRALKLIPLETVVDAVEIDPVSKSKKHCMQLILENKSYRFAAGDDEGLTKWLGAIKSTLVKSRR